MSTLDEIVLLARRQLELGALIEDLEGALSEYKRLYREIEQEDLPNAMKEAGLKDFALESGEKITIRPDYNVGIAEADRERAFNWLEQKGYDAIIKTSVAAEFGRGELGKAKQLAAQLIKAKLNVIMKRDVHWQTLKAFVAEQIREKHPIPMELFGVTPLNKAIIKNPKA